LRGGGVRPSSGITAIAAVITAIAFLLTGALLLLAALITPGHNGTCADATGATRLAVASDAATGRLTAVQRRNAAAIITIGRQRNLPDQAIVIALATASQESGFTNYANDGRGGDLIWSQAGVERSLRLPHEAVGTDHGSLGVFQQQWPWWGSMAQLMNPAGAADKFYDSLLQVAGWETMPVTVAAQRVQRSAFPSAYADDEPLARSMLETVGGPSSARDSVADCSPAASSGTVTFPLPVRSGYVDRRNWGGSGSHWAHGHTGTDLSVACGTPVLAATAGRTVVRTDEAWAGRWLVQVSTGRGRLTTWYAHLRRVDVHTGDTVTAGTQIGQVGDLGNATGCHLHFEVHPNGGEIYQDNINPSTWLQSHVRRGIQPVTLPH
jgi:hypothetical protein